MSLRISNALRKVAADINSTRDRDEVLSILRDRHRQWEGVAKGSFRNGRYYPYYDKVGKKWTIHYGLTDPAIIKKYEKTGMTPAEAQAAHNIEMGGHYDYLANRYPEFLKGLNPHQRASIVDYRYNRGPGAFYRDAVRKHLATGRLRDIPAAMAAANFKRVYDPKFTKTTPGTFVDAKGRYYKKKVIPGIDNRRKAEVGLYNLPYTPRQQPVRKPVPEPTVNFSAIRRKPAPEPVFNPAPRVKPEPKFVPPQRIQPEPRLTWNPQR